MLNPNLAVTVEDYIWAPQHPPIAGDRASQRYLGAPYLASVPTAIAELQVVLEPSVAATAEDARAEITRFDTELTALLGEQSEFAPLGAVLLRTESASSSQIEHITAGSRALALAELGIAKFGSNAGQVVANVEAMKRALDLAADVTPASILAVHEALMRHDPHLVPGEFRDQQVWIGGNDSSPHSATFVPPHHTRVPAAIEDLCAFVDRNDMSLIAQAAIAHAQFETIHPFTDGNGRTGRALVHALLKKGGAARRTTVPISAGLLGNTQAYFDALNAYRAGDPNPIVARFSGAAFAAIRNGRELAEDLDAIHSEWRTKVAARQDAVVWRILPLLLHQPAVTSKLVQARCQISQPAADAALNSLFEAGIVKKGDERGQERRRDRVWRSEEALAALDRFAERARRRS